MTAPVQHQMYIDGQFVSGHGDGWIDVLNPATEALLSRIPDGTAEEARLAIDAALDGDFPVVIGTTIFAACVFIVCNLLTDALHRLFLRSH